MTDQEQGRLITIEGGEGVGKSLFSGMLLQELRRLNISVNPTREPGGTGLAEKIRALFGQADRHESMHPETELMLISAARSQHVREVLNPGLARGDWYVCDRFADSSRVYQGLVGGLDMEMIERVCDLVTDGLSPDLTFVLDCPVEISMARVHKRSDGPDEIGRYDHAHLDTHRIIRDGYLSIARRFPQRIVVLDASRPVEKTFDEAVGILKKRFHIG